MSSLPPHLVSKILNIFSSSIFHSRCLTDANSEAAFKADIGELNYLYDQGLKIRLNSGGVTVRFATVLYVRDNIDLNTTLGFSKSFTEEYFCRLCRATKDQCQHLTVEREDLLRNILNYEDDLKNKTLKGRVSLIV